MKVSLSGKQFVFPRTCACCGAYAVTSLAVSGSERNKLARTRGWLWDIPYCVRCKRHIRAAERIQILGLALLAISISGAGVIALLTHRLNLLGVVIATAASADFALCWVLWEFVKSRRPKNCSGMLRAVRYLGANGHCHSFEIRSKFYAAEFVRANHHKIVNASAEVAGILKGVSFDDHQVPRRLLRKPRD